jgi:hypothetical protein
MNIGKKPGIPYRACLIPELAGILINLVLCSQTVNIHCHETEASIQDTTERVLHEYKRRAPEREEMDMDLREKIHQG